MHPARVNKLNKYDYNSGPVIYWMSRDQRISGNWALLFASGEARRRNGQFIVVFCLSDKFLGATERHYSFMLRGLSELKQNLLKLNIPFIILQDSPDRALPHFIQSTGAGMLITDFDPLRIKQSWKRTVSEQINIPFYEVDAHNIIPCRHVTAKAEYGAYTLRPKINRLIPEFLVKIPETQSFPSENLIPELTDYLNSKNDLLSGYADDNSSLFRSGEEAAKLVFNDFTDNKLLNYYDNRNDPSLAVQSGLSPYLHFGQISAQEIAWELSRIKSANQADERLNKSIDAFLEELIVRRELSDNFCYYNQDYDNFNGFPNWAKDSLDKHRIDVREHIYSPDEFENAETHNRLWNAAQLEMVHGGKMHGYMRMYWAKKILEWSASPEEAISTAIYLNDKYQFDGRDPNGYAGIAWSIGGVHDRPWFERSVFGKIRYMNYSGCTKKFNVESYIKLISDKYGVSI